MVTAALVKELREKTGAGMMDCKKVLTETDGDLEKAAELLREKGITKAAKKSGRIAAEGVVQAIVSQDGKVGAIVEVNSETDFVAKNEEFRTFVMDVAKQIVKNNPESVEALLAEPAMFEEGKTVNEALIGKIATIGENISIRRFARFETTDGLIEKYIHGDGKIAVLVNMTSGTKELAKDVCMQIAAARPEYLSKDLRDQIFHMGRNPFISDMFNKVQNLDQRKDIVESNSPAIILSTSGMLTGGNSVEYFKWLCEDDRNTLIFVGYQSEGSLGRRIQKGWKEVPLEEDNKTKVFNVKMEIKTINGFSGHSNRRQLMDYVKRLNPRPDKVITCHGDPYKTTDLASSIHRSYKIETKSPVNLDSVRIH